MRNDPHAQCRAADAIRSDDIINLCKEIDGLNASLTAAQARIESLTAELALRKDYADQVRAQSATIIRLGVELEACERPLRDRIEKLERMVVWAVESHCARVSGGLWVERVQGLHGLGYKVLCDGTTASILAAVEKAMGE